MLPSVFLKTNLMRQHYTILFIVLFCAGTSAQPVLNSDNGFNDGTTIQLFLDDAPALSEGNGGVNQTWDFSSLHTADAAVEFDGLLASATPYAIDFPGADLASSNL